MSKQRAPIVLCTGLAALLAVAAAQAQSPTFDCAKASGAVEQLICKDAGLAALDHKLDSVYKAAAAKAQGKPATELRETQRGWVKGRNDCWKATTQTWITATWTVDSIKGCVDAQYRVRTSELQALWRLVPPRTVAYACQNNPANEIVANFFATDPPTLRLERGDRTETLWRVPAGGQYEGRNVAVVQTGDALKVSWLDTNSGKTDELQCKPR
jgi:uncharacterized protein YecT (DUF1311 family)